MSSARIVFMSMALLSIVACRSARESSVGLGDGGALDTIAVLRGSGGSGVDGGGVAGKPGSGGTADSARTGGQGGGGGGGGGGGATSTGGSSVQIDAGATIDAPLEASLSCAAGQKLCGGACVGVDDPKYGCDPTLCSPSACPSVADATLVCQSGVCVVGTCGAGTKKCGSACVTVGDPSYGCGDATCDSSTCPNPGMGGTLMCQSGACVIATCAAGSKKCGDKCVLVSDPGYGCGAATCDATTCPAAGTGTLVCQGSVCVIGACGAGTKKCGDKCVPADANNGCADPARCTPCASTEACMGTPATTCQCVPTPSSTACMGKCGAVSNGCGGTYTCSTCTAPQTCNASNVCVCTPTPMATACSGRVCGSVSNGCGGTYTCGTCVAPQICSDAGTCGCTPITKAAACGAKVCNSVSDGCNGTISCGMCSAPTPTCNAAGACVCTPLTKAAACGARVCDSVSDGCNGTIPCGVCSAPTPTCSTAGACVCTPIDMTTACNGKCGVVPNGCGTTYMCPTGCKSPAVCTNNACVCPSTTCSCPQPNALNALTNPGFNTNTSGWSSSGGGIVSFVPNDDATSCQTSGSMKVVAAADTDVWACATVVPGAVYNWGLQWKPDQTTNYMLTCLIYLTTGSACPNPALGGAGASLNEVLTDSPPANGWSSAGNFEISGSSFDTTGFTRAILRCSVQGTVQIDMAYITPTNQGGHF